MDLKKNTANQRWMVFAFNRTTNAPVTGDDANISAKIQKDWGALTATADTNPTELEDGYYAFNLAKAETNGDALALFPESDTPNVQVIAVPGICSTGREESEERWYVSKVGSDSNDGHSWASPFLTVAEAVAAGFAASHRLSIGPGAFAEAIDLSALTGARIIGSRFGTKINPGTGAALKLPSYGYAGRLWLKSDDISGPGASCGLHLTGSPTGIVLEDCIVEGVWDGMYGSCHDFRASRCRFRGWNDGINFSGNRYQFNDCELQTAYATLGGFGDDYLGRAVFIQGGHGQWNRCSFFNTKAGATAVAGIGIRVTDGTHLFTDCLVRVGHAAAGSTGDATGVEVEGTDTLVTLQGGIVETFHEGTVPGTMLDLHNVSGTLRVSRLSYDTSKTSGTIENVDTIETVSTGARVVTITVNDGTNPLESARVRVTKGSESYVAVTDSLGRVNAGSGFSLDDGTWTVSISLPGYSFTPTTIVVNGTESATYSMTADTVPASSGSLVTGFLYCYDHEGVVEEGVEVDLHFEEMTGTGDCVDVTTRTETSSATGLVTFTNLFPGALYRMRRGKGHGWKRVTIPASAVTPYALPNLWGEDG